MKKWIKKLVAITLIFIVVIGLFNGLEANAGCKDEYNACGIFVVFEQGNDCDIYVDTETRVCYLRGDNDYIQMVDEYGNPKLWKWVDD